MYIYLVVFIFFDHNICLMFFSNMDNHQLLNILKMRTPDEAIRLQAVNYIRSTGSFEYTKKVSYLCFSLFLIIVFPYIYSKLI